VSANASGSARSPIPRTIWVYFAAVALVGTAFIAAFTVGTVAAFVITGSRGLTGLPATTATLGTAAAATLLSALMARRGRRFGLVVGLAIGVLGAAVTLLALALASQPILAMALLLVGFAGMGFANSAAQLTRYAAADLVPAAARGRAVGIVVWAGTVGAVIGPNLPNLVAPSVGTPGLNELTIGFAAVAVALVGALIVMTLLLRRGPDRSTLVPDAGEPLGTSDPLSGRAAHLASIVAPTTLADVLRLPAVRIGLVALVTAGLAMVAIMTMTPIHLIEGGHGLATVGLVLSAHTLGMFAFSPLAGRLADAWGPLRVIVAGFLVMAAGAMLAAAAPMSGGLVLGTALFLLGLGWNLAFVAGSVLLAREVPAHLRIRLQGLTDSLVWGAGAAASVLAGVLLELASYPILSLVGAGLALVPIALILMARRVPEPATEGSRAR
jgi:MFS family permease